MSRPARRGAAITALGAVIVLGLVTPRAGAAVSARDRAILAAGVVQRADVPAGWVSQKQTVGSGARYKGIPACKSFATVLNATTLTVPHRLSPEFSDPASATRTTLAANTAYAFHDATAAGRYLDAYRAARVAACLTQALQPAVKGSVPGASPTVSVVPLTDLAGLGDDAVGYRLTVTASSQGTSQTLYADIVDVRVGRAVLGFTFQNLGADLPSAVSIIRPPSNRVAPLAT
ncbi:MAG TPA: hypothetical protein VLV81_03805 [Acidimicrobiia bacterium]|nr:hypothetical protein [Acidimicrobiia bacterium]